MRGVLGPGDVVVDAGAYKGGYTYWMRGEVGASGHVFAFEPQPELAAFLRRVVEAFSWANVHVEEAGLSATGGELTLHAPGSGPSQDASLVGALAGAQARHYTVRIDTLDDFLKERRLGRPVDLIKCDVEGHELDTFRGAEGVLTQDRPLLLFECEARHNPGPGGHRRLRVPSGSRIPGLFFLAGEVLDVRQFDLEAHQTLGRAPYANNFVFEPL